MKTVLEARGVSKRYRLLRTRPVTLKEWMLGRLRGGRSEPPFHWALRDVDFDVRLGTTLGVIGHNGAGKSTLLRLTCGLGRPTEGRIIRRGQIHGLLELGSGFHAELTGRENVLTVGILSGFTARDVRRRFDDIVGFAELEDFIDQPVRTYSTGMYMRLAFATAMHFDPEVLVVDEVLAVGDARFEKKCVDRLRAFRAGGGTLVMASHASDQIRALCDEVLVLHEGRVVLHADPERGLERYLELLAERTRERAEKLDIARPAHSIDTTRSASASRQGTQEATIEHLRLLDGNGGPLETLPSGSDMLVEMHIRTLVPLSDLAITLSIWQGDDTKCVEAVIPSSQDAFARVPQTSIVRCRLPNLRLVPGTYYVNAGLYPPTYEYTYDYQWQMHALVIEHSDVTKPSVSGVLAVEPDWKLEEVSGGPGS